MALTNRVSKDSSPSGNVQLLEETLSDSSKVYSIGVTDDNKDNVIIECINLEAAEKLFNLLSQESDYLI